MDTTKIIFLLNEYIEHIGCPSPYMSDAKFKKTSYRIWAIEELISWIANADKHLPWIEKPSWKEVLESFSATIQAYSYKAKTKKTRNMWNIILKELDVVKLYLMTVI